MGASKKLIDFLRLIISGVELLSTNEIQSLLRIT